MKQVGSMLTGRTGGTGTPANPPMGGSNAGGTAVAPSRDDTRVAAWLAKQAPADMDRAAVLRAQSRGAGLRPRIEWRYPTGPNGEALPSYAVTVGCDVGGSPEARAAALADLRNFMIPAPVEQVEEWLAELSVIVAKRADSDLADGLRLEAYASRLARYPADVARAVTVDRRPMWKFWPSWSEIEAEADRLASPRRHMIAALEAPPKPREPERRPATDEERQRIAALVADLFPNTDPAMRDRAVSEALSGNCMTDAPQ